MKPDADLFQLGVLDLQLPNRFENNVVEGWRLRSKEISNVYVPPPASICV
jgi:hypothetical protein